MHHENIQTDVFAWQRAYALAISVCCISLSISFMVYGFGIRSTLMNGGIALGFSVALIVASMRMLTSRGALAALPYFMIGSAIFFGFGTFVTTLIPESMYKISFTTDVQRQMLAQVNAVNIAAISIVVLVAAPICMSVKQSTSSQRTDPGLQDVVARLERMLPTLLLVSIPVLVLVWGTFPRPTNSLLLGLLKMAGGIPLFTILLGGAVWTRLDGGRRALIVFLILGLSLEGFLSLGKLQTILPIVSFCIGLWIFKETRRKSAIIVATVATVYFMGMSDLINFGRVHANYDPLLNSPLERINILIDTSGSMAEIASQHYRGIAAQRFSIAPFEAHFMGLYDSGAPGDTLRNFFNVLIPRIVWSDKPLIAPGAEFDLVFRGYVAQSSLAIGFIAEAYWNLGWLGVVLISAMIGLQIGWFTRRWLLFCQHGLPYVGVFAMAPLVLQQSLWVETNIVGGYVGGMVKLMLFVAFIDMVVRAYIARRNNAELLRPAITLARLNG